MKVIYNRFIPFKGFKAMSMWPVILVRIGSRFSSVDLRHERIHFKQQKELFVLPFYVLYLLFTVWYGYRGNPFEREAYDNERDAIYLHRRQRFAWIKYLK